MTEDEVIQLGNKSRELLMHADFNELFELVRNEISAEMMATAYTQTADREALFHTYNGMRTFAERLHAYVLASEGIIQAREEATLTDNERSERFDLD